MPAPKTFDGYYDESALRDRASVVDCVQPSADFYRSATDERPARTHSALNWKQAREKLLQQAT
jgi:hypothetical protein